MRACKCAGPLAYNSLLCLTEAFTELALASRSFVAMRRLPAVLLNPGVGLLCSSLLLSPFCTLHYLQLALDSTCLGLLVSGCLHGRPVLALVLGCGRQVP